tara:strand:+ start:153 stop:1613 length:1461 start_codon:yes stop_codon:yes gene_type:complete
MKKIVIVGAGTAGLAAAAMMKSYWGDKVDISLYYDASKGNIAVGESTTPIIRLLLGHLGLSTKGFLQDLHNNATIKLGINFKNWIPGTEFFHGFAEILPTNLTNTSGIYSIPAGKFNGGINYNKPRTTIPDLPFEEYDHALHIDTKVFSDYMHEKLKGRINLVDDLVEDVVVENGNISRIRCKNSGDVEADIFVDASGFNAVLFKHLDPKWNDVSDCLPLDRAIPQQIPHKFKELPSFTLSEATENGWIWQIPIGDRYGTGYLYSSKFTSDEEARTKFNSWLLDNHNVELESDRIIYYKPGYYEDYWIGNCIAVGLSSGFIEPLEATGIQIILQQIQEFMTVNSTLKNLEYNKRILNKFNRTLYTDIIDFICLHYDTNRTDSDFWRYMTNNKTEWVKNFHRKCKEEFLDARTCYREKTFWGIDSFIQLGNAHNMFDNKSIMNFLDSKIDGQSILENMRSEHQYLEHKKRERKYISHKKVLDLIVNK